MSEAAESNVGLAFAVVTAAGLSTTLGAALAFVMPYSRSTKNLFLAACLSIAAGVMLYVSFVEIFVDKTISEFEDALPSHANLAYLYSTLCFFAGILITWIFDQLLHIFEHYIGKRRTKRKGSISTPSPMSSIETSTPADVEGQAVNNRPTDEPLQLTHPNDGEMVANIYEDAHDQRALIRMGIFAGIALAFHNFPEGLATYVATVEDASVGASVAIAIGIHNIPEGICVAMPIYYATGSRVKAFFWATLSGLTELVGAFFGWLILQKVITPAVYAILFGIVAGMMVYISLKELLPAAHRYDPEDKVTSYFLIIGMLIMAASLVLFRLN